MRDKKGGKERRGCGERVDVCDGGWACAMEGGRVRWRVGECIENGRVNEGDGYVS